MPYSSSKFLFFIKKFELDLWFFFYFLFISIVIPFPVLVPFTVLYTNVFVMLVPYLPSCC